MRFGERFDAALCLYDVVGTFPDNRENFAILRNIASHLKRGGRLLLSVMNLEMVESKPFTGGQSGKTLIFCRIFPQAA